MKLHIAFIVPGMAFNGNTLRDQSLGGSETAGLCMAREMARLGHDVFVFCNTDKPGTYDRVQYNPLTATDQFKSIPHDVTIVQRAPEIFRNQFNSKMQILWCHDLALSRQKETFCGVLWNVDNVFVLSQFMAEQYRKVYGLNDDLLYVTRNGIDIDLFPVRNFHRNLKQLVFAARPERGLDNLLTLIVPEVLKRDSEYRFLIAGYSNQPDPALAPFYQQCARVGHVFGDRVQFVGHLRKEELYRLYASSGAYVYPTPSPHLKNFAEISCISAMEAQAAGLPFITSNRGALPETLIDGASVLIDGDPWDKSYVSAFVDAIMDVTGCPNQHAQMSEIGQGFAKDLSWEPVAKAWEQQILWTIARHNDNPDRLARYFSKRSDGAMAMIAASDDKIYRRIEHRYPHHFDPKINQAFYTWCSSRMQGNWEDHTTTQRYVVTRDFLREKPGRRVLDFGCAYGFYTIPLAEEFPEREFTGIDISDICIKHCQTFKEQRTKKGKVDFRTADHNQPPDQRFDIVLFAETLEHCHDFVDAIQKVEKFCKPGGWMYITVPFGPWELIDDIRNDHERMKSDDNFMGRRVSNHVWEFDLHDLYNIFGEKPGLDISAVTAGTSAVNEDYLGWSIIYYQADHRPVGRIDLNRKMALQRPTETLSVNILGGPNSLENLDWCLKSVANQADEILIADCGIGQDPIACAVANRYGATLIPASDPISHGFETPRNELLEASTMDWVLWIDTDERLINPHRLKRYLRSNVYNGYALKQHHKSTDAEFKPDMPVRLFRRKPYHGDSMRFYGMIHEHAELGLNKGPGPVVVLGDISIMHIGYESEHVRKQRFQRNLPLMKRDRAKYPQRILGLHFQCRDNMLLAKEMLDRNGLKVDSEVTRLCEETVKIYRNKFMGKSDYVNVDTIQYYSEALKILDRGVDLAFGVQQANGGPLVGQTARFESSEDAIKEMEWRIKAQIEPKLDQYY